LAKGTTTEAEMKKMKNVEEQRRVNRRIKRVTGKGMGKQVTKCFSSHTGTRTEYNEKQAMWDVCRIENEARFTRSLDTDFMQPPLLDDMGLLADTPQVESMLNGTYDFKEGTGPYARMFIEAAQRPTTLANAPEKTQDHHGGRQLLLLEIAKAQRM
jgi:hypothetical protein